MFLIYGFGPRIKPLYYLGLKRCDNEGVFRHYFVYKKYQHISLFYIPIFIWKVRYVIACEYCQYGTEIEKGQLEKCKTLSKQLFTYKQTQAMIDYLHTQLSMMGMDDHTKEDLKHRLEITYDVTGHEVEVEHMLTCVLEKNSKKGFQK